MSDADSNVVFSHNGFEIHYVADDNRIYLNSPNNGQRMEVTPDLVHHLSEVILEKNIPYGGPEENVKSKTQLGMPRKPLLIAMVTVGFAIVGVAATFLTLWALKQRKPKKFWQRIDMRRYSQPLDKLKEWEIPEAIVRWKRK